VSRHANDLEIRELGPGGLHQFEPIHFRHLDVGNENCDPLSPQEFQRLLPVRSRQDRVTNVPDKLGDDVPHRLFIIYY
jgi:hypothetical protein